MERQGKKAIVLGATGHVGRLLTLRLLDDKRYTEVLILARNPFGLPIPSSQKLRRITRKNHPVSPQMRLFNSRRPNDRRWR